MCSRTPFLLRKWTIAHERKADNSMMRSERPYFGAPGGGGEAYSFRTSCTRSPQPQPWSELWERLPDKKQVGLGWIPSLNIRPQISLEYFEPCRHKSFAMMSGNDWLGLSKTEQASYAMGVEDFKAVPAFTARQTPRSSSSYQLPSSPYPPDEGNNQQLGNVGKKIITELSTAMNGERV